MVKQLLYHSILTSKDVMWPNNWLVEKTNSDEEMSENSNFILNELLKNPCFILDYGFTTNSQELFDTIGGCFEKYRYKF